jgi:hypothetical protein
MIGLYFWVLASAVSLVGGAAVAGSLSASSTVLAAGAAGAEEFPCAEVLVESLFPESAALPAFGFADAGLSSGSDGAGAGTAGTVGCAAASAAAEACPAAGAATTGGTPGAAGCSGPCRARRPVMASITFPTMYESGLFRVLFFTARSYNLVRRATSLRTLTSSSMSISSYPCALFVIPKHN